MPRPPSAESPTAEPPWLDYRETRAWRGFQEMQMQLGAEVARRLAADANMSAQDYTVLVVLTDKVGGRAKAVRAGRGDGMGEEPCLAPHQPHGQTGSHHQDAL
ncbi:MAG: hypothetical protein M5U19_18935 [Microthrixaceae bacterium]|nr:hypothetical protein [Microthrixaceae bacterium]